ncbi:MAG: type II toxin-antitoxin system VapC family toxin [Actinomycetota bacterium]
MPSAAPIRGASAELANVLLDSTVLIDYLKGRQGTVSRVDRLEQVGDVPFTCAINVEEVARGVRPREEDAFIRLLGGLVVAPLGIPEGRLAGYWRRTRAKRGRTASQSDALIAAAAVGVGGRIATGNPRDFDFPGVEVEHWPAGD